MIPRAQLNIFLSAVVGIAILLVAPILYANFQEQSRLKSLDAFSKNPTITGAVAERIIAQVATAEKIPRDEVPTVVQISDTSALASFGRVRRGDYILLYPKAELAVVFDDITKRIVNAVPVNIKDAHAK